MNIKISLPCLTALVLGLFLQAAKAGELSTYQGQITGVVCASCKDHVLSSLGKVKGVKDIQIQPTNLPEVRLLTIKSESEELTADELNKALSTAHGESYKVTQLARKKE